MLELSGEFKRQLRFACTVTTGGALDWFVSDAQIREVSLGLDEFVSVRLSTIHLIRHLLRRIPSFSLIPAHLPIGLEATLGIHINF